MPFTEQSLPWATGSHTSFKAAHDAGRRRGIKLAHLTHAYQAAGKRGLTDPEAKAMLSRLVGAPVPVQSICSLRGTLMANGLVSRGGERMGEFGKNVSVWFWIGQ